MMVIYTISNNQRIYLQDIPGVDQNRFRGDKYTRQIRYALRFNRKDCYARIEQENKLTGKQHWPESL